MKISELTLIKISSITLIIMSVLFSIMIIGFTYPFSTLDITQPMEILNEDKTVKPGETISFVLDYEKSKHYPTIAKKSFYCDNGWGYFYQPLPESLPVGEFRQEDKLISDYTLVPLDAPETTCHLVIDFEINLGFFGRTEGKIAVSENFYIKK